MGKTPQRCYLCGTPLRSFTLRPGEKPPPDFRTRDHIPPEGLFASPKPSNLLAVPCCFQCNNQHSGFDERLRIVASMPFDRNQTGQEILKDKVLGGTLAKGRQISFLDQILASMKPTMERPDLYRVRMEAREFHEGMIRITKGLLYNLHPGLNYHSAKFKITDMSPKPSNEQSRLMAMLKRGEHFERGRRAFQCWRHVDEARGGGAWMLVFYECFGFFVFHMNGPELDGWS